MVAPTAPPPDLLCPITRELYESPFVAQDGFSYEKTAIKTWFGKNTVSPMLGTELASQNIISNRTLKLYLETLKGMKARLVTHNRSIRKPLATVEEQKTLPEGVQKLLDEVVSHYYMATRDIKDCCSLMQHVYSLAPRNYDVLVNYTNILRFGSHFEEALKAIKEMRAIRRHCLIPKYMKVRILSEMNKKEEALQKFNKIMTQNRMLDHTLLEVRFMSYSSLSTERKGDAKVYITAYISLVPKDARALSHKIYLHLLNEKYPSPSPHRLSVAFRLSLLF